MGRFTSRLFFLWGNWDRVSQMSFVLALLLIIPVVVIGTLGPDDFQMPAIASVMGLIIVAQVIFMWANRNMITAYAKAQRLYLRGEFNDARILLEGIKDSDEFDIYARTLLGNVYRQLGDLDTSESVLYEAVNMNPNHYFPLYGFGRTLLSKGRYQEAIEAIRKSLNNGAESVIVFDLAEALFRSGEEHEAGVIFERILPELTHEPHRRLMAEYLLNRLEKMAYPAEELIHLGLPYWENSAQLFVHTPYGQILAQDIQDLRLS